MCQFVNVTMDWGCKSEIKKHEIRKKGIQNHYSVFTSPREMFNRNPDRNLSGRKEH